MPFVAAAVAAIAQGVGYVAAAAATLATGSIGAGVTIGTMVTSLASRALLSAAISWAASAITPKPKMGIRGDSQKPVTDPNAPRVGIIGETALAGSLVTWQTWGTNNEYIILLFALADHKCHSLTGVWWSGGWATVNGDGSIEESKLNGKYHLWVTFYDGSWGQTADAELITQSAGRWTSNDRGRGVAYVKVKARRNDKVHEQGLSGLFSMLFKVKGAFLYDRRLDSTAGGSGTQRENDQTTWTWTDNAGVATENVLRGIRVEDTSMPAGSRTTDTWFGCGLTSSDMPYTENAAGFTSCDDAITLKAGGTEKRYRANGLIWGDESPRSTIEGLLAAQAGRLLTGPGRWIIRPGVSRSIDRSFTDSSFRIDGPASYRDYVPLGEIVNCVTGRFCDPAQQYKPNPLPARVNPTYEAADGGRKSESWDLAFVTSQTQGQRILKIFLERHRRQKTARRTLTPENLDLEALDWLGWQSDRHGWDLDFEIEKIHPRMGDDDFLQIVADLRETDASVYAWTAASDELDPSTATPISGGTIAASAVAGLAVTATTTTATGEVKPGLLIGWTSITDPTCYAVRCEIRKQGTTNVFVRDQVIDPTTSATQEMRVDEGIVGSATFEVRAARLYDPWLEPVFSSWVAAGASTSAATVPVAWSSVSSRPTELTDGRVSAGLDSSGDLARVVAADKVVTASVVDGDITNAFAARSTSTLALTTSYQTYLTYRYYPTGGGFGQRIVVMWGYKVKGGTNQTNVIAAYLEASGQVTGGPPGTTDVSSFLGDSTLGQYPPPSTFESTFSWINNGDTATIGAAMDYIDLKIKVKFGSNTNPPSITSGFIVVLETLR